MAGIIRPQSKETTLSYDYSSIMASQAQRIESELATAAAELEAARHREDAYGVNDAADRILQLDAQRAALAQRANSFAAAQSPTSIPGTENLSRADAALVGKYQRYGITADNLQVAKGWTGDAHMTDDQKIESYLVNQQKYRQARASGEYRDDQGKVTR
jgi:hypothetical protein